MELNDDDLEVTFVSRCNSEVSSHAEPSCRSCPSPPMPDELSPGAAQAGIQGSAKGVRVKLEGFEKKEHQLNPWLNCVRSSGSGSGSGLTLSTTSMLSSPTQSPVAVTTEAVKSPVCSTSSMASGLMSHPALPATSIQILHPSSLRRGSSVKGIVIPSPDAVPRINLGGPSLQVPHSAPVPSTTSTSAQPRTPATLPPPRPSPNRTPHVRSESVIMSHVSGSGTLRTAAPHTPTDFRPSPPIPLPPALPSPQLLSTLPILLQERGYVATPFTTRSSVAYAQDQHLLTLTSTLFSSTQNTPRYFVNVGRTAQQQQPPSAPLFPRRATPIQIAPPKPVAAPPSDLPPHHALQPRHKDSFSSEDLLRTLPEIEVEKMGTGAGAATQATLPPPFGMADLIPISPNEDAMESEILSLLKAPIGPFPAVNEPARFMTFYSANSNDTEVMPPHSPTPSSDSQCRSQGLQSPPRAPSRTSSLTQAHIDESIDNVIQMATQSQTSTLDTHDAPQTTQATQKKRSRISPRRDSRKSRATPTAGAEVAERIDDGGRTPLFPPTTHAGPLPSFSSSFHPNNAAFLPATNYDSLNPHPPIYPQTYPHTDTLPTPAPSTTALPTPPPDGFPCAAAQKALRHLLTKKAETDIPPLIPTSAFPSSTAVYDWLKAHSHPYNHTHMQTHQLPPMGATDASTNQQTPTKASPKKTHSRSHNNTKTTHSKPRPTKKKNTAPSGPPLPLAHEHPPTHALPPTHSPPPPLSLSLSLSPKPPRNYTRKKKEAQKHGPSPAKKKVAPQPLPNTAEADGLQSTKPKRAYRARKKKEAPQGQPPPPPPPNAHPRTGRKKAGLHDSDIDNLALELMNAKVGDGLPTPAHAHLRGAKEMPALMPAPWLTAIPAPDAPLAAQPTQPKAAAARKKHQEEALSNTRPIDARNDDKADHHIPHVVFPRVTKAKNRHPPHKRVAKLLPTTPDGLLPNFCAFFSPHSPPTTDAKASPPPRNHHHSRQSTQASQGKKPRASLKLPGVVTTFPLSPIHTHLNEPPMAEQFGIPEDLAQIYLQSANVPAEHILIHPFPPTPTPRHPPRKTTTKHRKPSNNQSTQALNSAEAAVLFRTAEEAEAALQGPSTLALGSMPPPFIKNHEPHEPHEPPSPQPQTPTPTHMENPSPHPPPTPKSVKISICQLGSPTKFEDPASGQLKALVRPILQLPDLSITATTDALLRHATPLSSPEKEEAVVAREAGKRVSRRPVKYQDPGSSRRLASLSPPPPPPFFLKQKAHPPTAPTKPAKNPVRLVVNPGYRWTYTEDELAYVFQTNSFLVKRADVALDTEKVTLWRVIHSAPAFNLQPYRPDSRKGSNRWFHISNSMAAETHGNSARLEQDLRQIFMDYIPVYVTRICDSEEMSVVKYYKDHRYLP